MSSIPNQIYRYIKNAASVSTKLKFLPEEKYLYFTYINLNVILLTQTAIHIKIFGSIFTLWYGFGDSKANIPENYFNARRLRSRNTCEHQYPGFPLIFKYLYLTVPCGFSNYFKLPYCKVEFNLITCTIPEAHFGNKLQARTLTSDWRVHY